MENTEKKVMESTEKKVINARQKELLIIGLDTVVGIIYQKTNKLIGTDDKLSEVKNAFLNKKEEINPESLNKIFGEENLKDLLSKPKVNRLLSFSIAMKKTIDMVKERLSNDEADMEEVSSLLCLLYSEFGDEMTDDENLDDIDAAFFSILSGMFIVII